MPQQHAIERLGGGDQLGAPAANITPWRKQGKPMSEVVEFLDKRSQRKVEEERCNANAELLTSRLLKKSV